MFFRRRSSESTNDNSEQTPDSSSLNVEYPAFDSEAAKRRIAEYKAAHPNAVEDIKKAEAMAYAGNPYRTDARKSQKRAEELLKFAKEAQTEGKAFAVQGLIDMARELHKSVSTSNSVADYMEEEAGKQYDYDQDPDKLMRDAVVDYTNNKPSTPSRSRFKSFGKPLREQKNDTNINGDHP